MLLEGFSNLSTREVLMAYEFWIAALVIAGFAIYIAAKVRMYMRQSDAEWKKVDKSKLKTWNDDD
jgi:hypothetical protein